MEPLHNTTSRRTQITNQSPPHLVNRHNDRGHHQPTLFSGLPSHHNGPPLLLHKLQNPSRFLWRIRTPHPDHMDRLIRPNYRPIHIQIHKRSTRAQPEATYGNWTLPIMPGNVSVSSGGENPPSQGNQRRVNRGRRRPGQNVGNVASAATLFGWPS